MHFKRNAIFMGKDSLFLNNVNKHVTILTFVVFC